MPYRVTYAEHCRLLPPSSGAQKSIIDPSSPQPPLYAKVSQAGEGKWARALSYSTVTDFARFLGWSTSVPMKTAA
jgi:hypothetical protein